MDRTSIMETPRVTQVLSVKKRRLKMEFHCPCCGVKKETEVKTIPRSAIAAVLAADEGFAAQFRKCTINLSSNQPFKACRNCYDASNKASKYAFKETKHAIFSPGQQGLPAIVIGEPTVFKVSRGDDKMCAGFEYSTMLQKLQEIAKGTVALTTGNLTLLGWDKRQKFIIDCPVIRACDYSAGQCKDERVGRVTNISLGDDDTFYYDVDFTPGFGGRKESHIPECELRENLNYQYLPSMTMHSTTPAQGGLGEQSHYEGVIDDKVQVLEEESNLITEMNTEIKAYDNNLKLGRDQEMKNAIIELITEKDQMKKERDKAIKERDSCERQIKKLKTDRIQLEEALKLSLSNKGGVNVTGFV